MADRELQSPQDPNGLAGKDRRERYHHACPCVDVGVRYSRCKTGNAAVCRQHCEAAIEGEQPADWRECASHALVELHAAGPADRGCAGMFVPRPVRDRGEPAVDQGDAQAF
jgi:hypothetical protein